MLRRTSTLVDRVCVALIACSLFVGCMGDSERDASKPAAGAGTSSGGSSQGGGGSNQGGSTAQGGDSAQGGGGSSQGGTAQGAAGSPTCPPAPAPFTNPEGCPEQQPIYQGPQGSCELDSSVVCNLYVSTQNACPAATLPAAFSCCQGNWQGAPCYEGAGGNGAGGGGGEAP